jgi:hypothetical protein
VAGALDLDQDNAGSLELGASGGLLRDLGSHLVDQMLWLLGPASHVHATLDWTDRFGERTDCGFVVTMTHASGTVSTVSASKLNHSTTRELRAYGSRGTYIASGADVQADALMSGHRPVGNPQPGASTRPKTGAPCPRRTAARPSPRRRGTMPVSIPSSPALSAATGPNPYRRRTESGRWRYWMRPAAAVENAVIAL